MSLHDDHMLKKLCLEAGSSYTVKDGTPLEYLNFASKDLEKRLREKIVSQARKEK